MIIDLEFVTGNSINTELVNSVSSEPAEITKLIGYISNRIFTDIDKSLFYDEETEEYVYPDDLQLATLYLLQALYEYRKVEWMMKYNKSIKIDDVSHVFQDVPMRHWLPMDEQAIEILEKYKDVNMWYIDVSFSNYDD